MNQRLALAALRAELGVPDRTVAPVGLEDVAMEEPALKKRALGGLRDAVGEEWVRQDRLTRVTHAAGRLVAWRIVLWAALAMPIAGAVIPPVPLPVPAFAASFVSDMGRAGAPQSLTAISGTGAQPSAAAESTRPALAPVTLLALYIAGLLWLATRAGRS